jgi:putative Holliday junction resolvase
MKMMATERATASHSLVAVTPEAKPRRRILAIDYGRKRIGLALSDELCLTARPLSTLVRVNRQDDIKRLRETCRNHAVARIIVGHPLHMTGQAGDMADEAARFATRLRKQLGREVELVDERLTSWEAGQMRSTIKPGGTGKRQPIDDVAAAVLLRDYLDQRAAHAPGEAEKD